MRSFEYKPVPILTFTTLWANSADDKLMTVSLENMLWQYMQIISFGDNLLEMSSPIFWENNKKIF